MSMAPALMIGLAVVSAGMQAFSMIQQGQAAKAAADANAKVMRDRAEAQRRLGLMAKQREERETAGILGLQRAQFAARGFSLDEGTPVEVLAYTAQQREWKGELDQWQHEAGATQSINEASIEEYRGQQAANAGLFGAAGALVGGFGKAFSLAPQSWFGSPASNGVGAGLVKYPEIA